MAEKLLDPGSAPRRAVRKGCTVHGFERLPDVATGAALRRREGCGPSLRNLRCVRSCGGGAAAVPLRYACRAEYGPSDARRAAAGDLPRDGYAAKEARFGGQNQP